MHHQAAVGPSQAMPIYVESRGRHVGRQAARKPWDSPMAPGDAVLYAADPTPADLLIADVEHSIWIHAGMLAWNDEREEWEIVDTRQWVGGKRTPLIEAVRANPGHWHLFHADAGGRWPEFNRRLCVAKADEVIDRPYGWFSLARDGLSHLPLLGWLARDLCDGVNEGRLPYCAEHVTLATRDGGGVNIVPGRPACFVEPVHLAQSEFYEHRGPFFPADEV